MVQKILLAVVFLLGTEAFRKGAVQLHHFKPFPTHRDAEFVTVQAVYRSRKREHPLNPLADHAQDLIPEAFAIQFVDMLEAIQTEDEQMQGMLGPLLQHGLDVLFEFQLVEQPGHVDRFLFFWPRLVMNPANRLGSPSPSRLQIAPAADPDPLALTVFCPVLNAMEVGPPVSMI